MPPPVFDCACGWVGWTVAEADAHDEHTDAFDQTFQSHLTKYVGVEF